MESQRKPGNPGSAGNAGKKQRTVRQRMFRSYALMVVVTLCAMALINVGVAKLYWEIMEKAWKSSLAAVADPVLMEHLLKGLTVRRESFYLLILLDVAACVGVWILVSIFFTRRMTRRILKPLEELGKGAARIRENILTQPVLYRGDAEFEAICDTFNDMQAHILEEREKNRKYEKARTEMIAGISHDLRSPLTAIRGAIKALMDHVLPSEEQRQKFLETAYRRSGEMDLLLDQLFYLSKLETGNIAMNLQPVDLAEFAENYGKERQELLKSEHVQIMVETEPEEQTKGQQNPVIADPGQLRRIFDNLLENSKKYSGADPLEITIRIGRTPAGSSITFADNGGGVPEDKIAHIFEEFYRADEARGKSGSGLGLYIVKCLLAEMGGTVRAENRGGLCICMELPKGEAEDGEPENIDRGR